MDLCFSHSVIQIHHTNVPTSVGYYGYKLLGSFVGSDEYVLHALSMYVVQLNSLADRLITLCVHYQHCFRTKVSRIIRTFMLSHILLNDISFTSHTIYSPHSSNSS